VVHDIDAFDAIANILSRFASEYNMTFIKNAIENDSDDINKGEGEINILAIDSTISSMISVRIKGFFEEFNMKDPERKFGIDSTTLRRYLHNVKDYRDDGLTITYTSEIPNSIRFRASNNSNTEESSMDLRLLALRDMDINENSNQKSSLISICMLSSKFQKTCSYLGEASSNNDITIKCNESNFIISSKGDISEHCVTFGADAQENVWINKLNDNQPCNININIDAIYNLKGINRTSGYHNTFTYVEICFTDKHLMIMRYLSDHSQMTVYCSPYKQASV